MTRKKLIASTVAILAFAGIAWAGVVLDAYSTMVDAPSLLVDDASGADSLTTGAAPLTDRAKKARGNTTVAAAARGTAGETLEMHCVSWHLDRLGTTWTELGVQTTTVTFGSVAFDGALSASAPVALFDSLGATHYEIRHAAPSSGTIDIMAWSYGADTQ